jgi:hypothetical protein
MFNQPQVEMAVKSLVDCTHEYDSRHKVIKTIFRNVDIVIIPEVYALCIIS